MGGAERQRVQQLQERQRTAPAGRTPSPSSARRAGRADHQQHGRLKERRQPSRDRKQHDFRDDAERPQRRDRRAVEPGAAPFQRREAVIDRVAGLDQARRRQHGDEGGIAQAACAAAAAHRARGAGAAVEIGASASDGSRSDRSSPPRSARSDVPRRDNVGRKAGGETAQDEGRRAPQPHRPIGAARARSGP